METGFYYLGSRYYNPELCRFISADSVIGAGVMINGCNMYTYCTNNPINMLDPQGQWPKWIKNIANKIKKEIEKVVNIVTIAIKATTKNQNYSIVNNVVRTSYTSPSVMFDGGPIIGKIGFSSTTTSSDKEPGAVYSYVDFGNEANSGGLGFNAFDYIGGEIGASTEGNVFVNGQLGQAVHGGVSFGFDGIGLSAGVNIENTSYDFEIKAGWGTIVFWYLAPYLGGAVY